jgi:hypothetical protein
MLMATYTILWQQRADTEDSEQDYKLQPTQILHVTYQDFVINSGQDIQNVGIKKKKRKGKMRGLETRRLRKLTV